MSVASTGRPLWALFESDHNGKPVFVREPVLGLVAGIDERGDATVLALVASLGDTAELVPAGDVGFKSSGCQRWEKV